MTAPRPLDPDFPPEERLFHALRPAAFGDGTVIPANLDAVDVSVDRERHGGSEASVLEPPTRSGWGVVEWRAASVAATFEREQGEPIALAPEDDPLPENPAHAEIRARRQDREQRQMHSRDLAKGLKMEIRLHLAARARVLRIPTPPGSNAGS